MRRLHAALPADAATKHACFLHASNLEKCDFHAWTLTAGSLITLTFLFVAVQISNICMKISKFWHEKVE